MSTELQSILERKDVPADVKDAISKHLDQEGRRNGDCDPLRALGAFLRAGLIVEDDSGAIKYVNERLTQLLGVTMRELEGRKLSSILTGEGADSPLFTPQREVSVPREALLASGNGEPVAVTLMPFPLFDPEGRYQGRFTVVVRRGAPSVAPPEQAFDPLARAVSNNRLLHLSSREREILGELLAGRRVNDVAERLSISRHTVRNHLKAIYRKLGVHSQVELIGRFWPGGAAGAASS